VGAAHAGWRGLLDGVIEATATRLAALAGINPELRAFLGPTIGAATFEVGAEVRAAFMNAASKDERCATDAAFVPCNVKPGKYLANLVLLARLRLARVGIENASGGYRVYRISSRIVLFLSTRRQNRPLRRFGLDRSDGLRAKDSDCFPLDRYVGLAMSSAHARANVTHSM
jgi:copper oxidase (laccase) domain-containing protein